MSKVPEIIEQLVAPIATELNLELVDVEFIKEGPDYFLRVYVDTPQGGIDIEQCVQVSERLSLVLDENDPIEQNYYLEVSSPGLDRPLKKDKDFVRYKGRDVEIKLYKPMNGSKQFEGELVGLTEDNNIKVIIDNQEVEFTRKEVALIRLAIKF